MIENNAKYQQLEVEDGVYIPDIGIDYPTDDPHKRIVPAKHIYDIKFDDTYPYIDHSTHFRWHHRFAYALLYTHVFITNRVKYGLRIHGRDILKKYAKQLDEHGAITIGNHCFRWDVPCILQAIRYRELWIPMYAEHFLTKDNWYLVHIGGIPLPATMGGQRKFIKAFDELHSQNKWFHFFPEGTRWDFYKPIKPFQPGAFDFAYKYNMPILPVVITYRERKGIFRLFAPKEIPLLDVTIGEPIWPDMNNNRKDEVLRLQKLCHKVVCDMVGIKNNPWPDVE